MTGIGQRARSLLAGSPSAAWAVAGAGAALLPALLVWGFTVDDALVAVRYARHLAAGVGYRFNVGGPITDGVTPLPWPFLVAPLARGAEPLAVLARLQVLGLFVWTASAALLGAEIGRAAAPRWAKRSALFILALSVPFAAHAVSGMETAVATALATLAACAARRPFVAAGLAGLTASLRPELAPWALGLALGLTLA